MIRERIPSPRRCASFRPGHTVHWIQALHTANKPEERARTRPGRIQLLEGEVIEVRFDDGTVRRYRNHDTGRLAAKVSRSTLVRVNEGYSILRAGSFGFSIARDKGRPLEPCVTECVKRFNPRRWSADHLTMLASTGRTRSGAADRRSL